MKFYNRQKEIVALREIETNSKEIAQMTVMIGRRRVGKTTLLKRAFENTPTLYFFVAKKNEVLLCEEFTREMEDRLSVSLGRFQTCADLFKALMILSKARNFTLVIDEFLAFNKT